MKVLRIKLHQNKAAYSREEMITNRMSYPLPPYSTVIGALHNACGYTEYHPMELSIQGKYGSRQKEIYVNHGLLNRREDDRNILVYLHNPQLLSAGYLKVGEGLKAQGNSFKKRKTVRIDHMELYHRYCELLDLKDALSSEKKNIIQPKIVAIKTMMKGLQNELKGIEKKTDHYNELKRLQAEAKSEIERMEHEYKNKLETSVTKPLSHFRTLVTGPKYQEVLYDVELVIHVKSDSSTVNEILQNMDNLVSIGRSEDYVDILEAKEVDLVQPEDEISLKWNYAMYVNVERVECLEENEEEDSPAFLFKDGDNPREAKGTVYYLNKDYTIIDNKRNFQKIPCLYSSYFAVDSESNTLVDQDGYITDFN